MDDISGKISELFSNPESMDAIKNIIGMLGNSGGDDGGGNDGGNGGGNGGGGRGGGGGGRAEEERRSDSSDMPFDADTLFKMKKAFDLMRKDDPRVTLLLALKPNLSEERRKKVDEAIHLLRLINLIPLLQDGILKF